MSSRCTIAAAGPVHIYAECNDAYKVCVSNLTGVRNTYNGDITIRYEELRKLYEDLKQYYEVRGNPYERYNKKDEGK